MSDRLVILLGAIIMASIGAVYVIYKRDAAMIEAGYVWRCKSMCHNTTLLNFGTNDAPMWLPIESDDPCECEWKR